MKQYQDFLVDTLTKGTYKTSRTGVDTISRFGYQMRFDLAEGFPLVTTKKTHMKSIIHELLWFLKGDTNIKYLQDNNVRIWNEWADEQGDLGPVYGAQWRNWNNEGIDQISEVIELIKNNPNSRRMMVTAWNPSVLPDTSQSFSWNVKQGNAALPPCHAFFQFYVADDKLSCQLYQRSADIFLGVPFNIAGYALFTEMMAKETGLEAGEFIHTFGDAHIYVAGPKNSPWMQKNFRLIQTEIKRINTLEDSKEKSDYYLRLKNYINTSVPKNKEEGGHLEQVLIQLSREPKELPSLELNPDVKDIFSYKYEDISIKNYEPHPPISGKVAV